MPSRGALVEDRNCLDLRMPCKGDRERRGRERDLKGRLAFFDRKPCPVRTLALFRADGEGALTGTTREVWQEYKVQPGRDVRIHYITQGAVRPPTFILWANQDGLSASYKRFITNRLRETYGFRGTPIRIFLKVRKDRHDDPAYQK